MGLAASQARFLAVTARKTNCEFQSMQIAQNKLSVTRELAQATQDYQNSLNATKLVWDYDCDQSGYLIEPCENAKSLAFNTLMMPTVYNNYQPYLITTRTGAVVLNSKYAAAARAAGITEGVGGQQRSQAGFYRFLDGLASSGLLPESTSNVIKEGGFVIYNGKMAEDGGTTYVYDHLLDSTKNSDQKIIDDNRLINESKYELDSNENIVLRDADGNTLETDASGNKTYKNANGEIIATKAYGTDILLNSSNIRITDTETINKLNENNFKESIINDRGYIKGYDPYAGFGSTPLSKNSMIAANLVGLSLRLDNATKEVTITNGEATRKANFLPTSGISTNTTGANEYKLALNGSLVSQTNAKDISIGDLLTNDITLVYTLGDNKDTFSDKDPDINDVKGKIPETFKTYISDSIAVMINALKDIGIDATTLSRVENIVNQMYTTASANGEATGKRDTGGALNTAITQANNYNSIYVVTTEGNKNNCSVAVSLSNIFANILTLVDNYINGRDSKYTVSTKVEDSNFVTMDENYSYPINSSNSTSQDMLLLTDFYMQLYNNLCINGWTENEAVENDYSFNQLIKNGSYFISTIGDDGYFYQSRYNAVDKLIEVKDEDAIAQAEIEFQRIKATLTYKEDKLDLDMKNLDAEISSLTTELDSVKNLISKNVEKTFTMFQ